MVAPLRSVPQRFLVAGLKAALLGGGVLSGLETAGAALFMGGGGYVGWVVGCLAVFSGAVRLRRSPPRFRAVFADGLFLREPIRENHECATDGCTAGHLYLSQMIFGQGDPWSLV